MNAPEEIGHLRCTHCRGLLAASGQEPYRVICDKCGQNFFVVLRVEPVDPLRTNELPERVDVGSDT